MLYKKKEKIFLLLKTIALYVIGLIIINLLFSILLFIPRHSMITFSTSYSTSDLIFFDYLYYSFITFYGIGYGDIAPIGLISQIICIVEGAIGAIYSFTFAGLFAYRLLKPVNPISISNKIVINTDKQQIQFRFRVDYPKGIYLFNVEARVRFICEHDLVSGHVYSSSFKHILKFPQIRGVWFVDLPYSYNHIKNNSGNDFITLVTNMRERKYKKTFVEFSIKGISDESKTMFKITRYALDNIYDGYSFVSVRKSEYDPIGYSAKHIEEYKLKNFNRIQKCSNPPLGLQ